MAASGRRAGRHPRARVTLTGMPVPSRVLKEEVDDTIDHHAATLGHWPALAEVEVRWRGSFGYLTALIAQDGPDERVPLCRIEYLGDHDEWGFAIHDAATDAYTPALLHTGAPTGRPTDAFDTAALVHLADYTA
ncbi:hypothetical protein AQJ91_48295 [Streptomyces dysideae]|uniref:Uncharacterized protein n=2 Tax=Streptomyces dysideae TaxID=909626 RepID=A0A124IBP4_9ACTN|nr:hypothetical protein AQJ91_48295 [Streptomyces dysideae]